VSGGAFGFAPPFRKGTSTLETVESEKEIMPDNCDSFVLIMPDGRAAPSVLTETELIRLLRLDTLCLDHPDQTLKRYREQRVLRPTKISGRNFYTQRSVQAFLQTQTKTE